MSTTNAPAYCEIDDVQTALQHADEKMTGSLADGNVQAAIHAASRWLRSAADTHWYDSNADASDLIDTAPASTTDRQLDVPSSPHAQRGQLFKASDERGNPRYPKTHAGPYCRVRLPKAHVESIDTLKVRDRAGEVEDWVAASDKAEGRGEDYYLHVEGGAHGRSYLYVHAGTLAPLTHYTDALTVGLSYGRDWDDAPWDDVRRGVAALAGAHLITDDELQTLIPDSGQLIGVDTKADRLLSEAFESPGYLAAFLGAPVA